MERVPEDFLDLFEKPSIATFASFLPSGHPQVVPVWVDYEEPHLVVVTRTDTRKYQNVRHDPRVTVTVIDPEDNYRYVEARGEVAEITTDGALAFSDRQAQRYWGVDEYPYERDTERALLYVEPERVVARNVGSPNRT